MISASLPQWYTLFEYRIICELLLNKIFPEFYKNIILFTATPHFPNKIKNSIHAKFRWIIIKLYHTRGKKKVFVEGKVRERRSRSLFEASALFLPSPEKSLFTLFSSSEKFQERRKKKTSSLVVELTQPTTGRFHQGCNYRTSVSCIIVIITCGMLNGKLLFSLCGWLKLISCQGASIITRKIVSGSREWWAINESTLINYKNTFLIIAWYSVDQFNAACFLE